MSNIYDAFEPLYKMQESIRKMTAPYDSASAVFEQMNRTASIARQITSAEWIAQQYPSLSAMQNVLQNIKFPQFDVLPMPLPNFNPLSEFLTQTQGIIEAATGTEAMKSFIGTKSAIQELSFRIQEITLKDANVYFPEQLIPDDYIFNVEPEYVEYKRDDSQSECIGIKKLSPLDAFNIICALISVLFAVIGFLQDQISPSQEQVQTIIEEQSETNKILQQQLDTTAKTVDYLSTILLEIQTNMEESEAIHQQNPERSEDEDSDSQSTDSAPFGSQSENPTSHGGPDVPDMN